MLIINADDYGRSVAATDNSLECFRQGRITSASVMVFMKDSRRAAESALVAGMDIGLHLNLNLPLDGPAISPRLLEGHTRIVKFFRIGRLAHLLYNPFLRKDIDFVFKAQYEEYFRLFNREPIQIDGHQHIHLCVNVLMGRVIPSGLRVRRNFTFGPGEKSIVNRAYRLFVDSWLTRRYICADAFFSIEPIQDLRRLAGIVSRARSCDVELMVHPAVTEQYDYLISPQFLALIAAVPKGTYRLLTPARKP